MYRFTPTYTIAGILLLFLSAGSVFAQQAPRYYEQWYFGDSVGLDFLQNPVQKIYGPLSSAEGCASICDPETGNILMFTNGETVWNRNGDVMPNGSGLRGHVSSTQSSLIIPLPGSKDIFYVFTARVGPYMDDSIGGIDYHVVDMREDAGNGDLVIRDVPLIDSASERLVGIRHCNGRDFWVVAHELWTNRFVSWKVTEDGIVDTVYSSVGQIYDYNLSLLPSIGNLKASPDGRYLFSVFYRASRGELLEFDKVTGQVVQSIAVLPGSYGASFSPDSRYLFTVNSGAIVERYSVNPLVGQSVDQTRLVVGDLGESFGFNRGIRSMQIGPDGNIYAAVRRFNKSIDNRMNSIGIIENPNLPSARFRDSAIVFEDPPGLDVTNGLPNCIDGFLSGQTDSSLSQGIARLIVEDTVMCPGDTLKLEVRGGTNSRWIAGDNRDCDDCPEISVWPDSTTEYRVQVFNVNCSGYDTLAVTIHVLSNEVDAGADTSVCSGGSVRLHASGKFDYRWNPSTGLSCDDCADPVATPDSTTTYILEGSKGGECVAYDSLVVTVLQPYRASLDTAMCQGDSVQIRLPSGSEFNWSPATGITCLDCSDPMVFPDVTTTYYVQWVDSNGCELFDSIRVNVNNIAVMGDTTFCAGGSARLRVEGARRYRWTPSGSLSCDTCSDPLATPMVTTTYHVAGSLSDGSCELLDSVTVTVHPLPEVNAGERDTVCLGESIELRASGGKRYLWDPAPDLHCWSCSRQTITPSESRWYYVTAFNEFDCESRDSVEIVVVPDLTIEAGKAQEICPGDSVQLGVEGGVRWRWTPAAGLNCDTCRSPLASPDSTTVYHVRAWSAEGCEAEDSVCVVVGRGPDSVRFWISRDHKAGTGEDIIIPVEAADSGVVTGITELSMIVRYDFRVMRLDPGSFARLLEGTALDGWVVEAAEPVRGEVHVRLTAPPGRTLTIADTLLRFSARLFLSDIRGTELPLEVLSNAECLTLDVSPGYAELDSICGLDFRMIELFTAKYAAPVVYPNPAHDRVRFEFSLGLEGHALMEVFDINGQRTGVLVNRYLESGAYSVDWDVSALPSGQYRYRLQSGDWIQSGVVNVKQ